MPPIGKGTVETKEQVAQRHWDMVLRLAKPGEQILRELTAEDCHLLHIAGCIQGEAAELYEAYEQQADMTEELGDAMFYLVALLSIFNFPANPDTLTDYTQEKNLVQLLVQGGNLWDVVKRAVIYRKPIDMPKTIEVVRTIEKLINSIIERGGYNRTMILHLNWVKLADKDKGRYASGTFTNEQAQERRDKLPG